MEFFTEPRGYEKTLLSDLQGAWGVLRQAVVDHAGFEGWDRVLFHIDEAMSWETVRHLERMDPTFRIPPLDFRNKRLHRHNRAIPAGSGGVH